MVTRLGLDTGEPDDLTEFDRVRLTDEGKARADARSTALEEELLLLRTENAGLRAENDQIPALRRDGQSSMSAAITILMQVTSFHDGPWGGGVMLSQQTRRKIATAAGANQDI